MDKASIQSSIFLRTYHLSRIELYRSLGVLQKQTHVVQCDDRNPESLRETGGRLAWLLAWACFPKPLGGENCNQGQILAQEAPYVFGIVHPNYRFLLQQKTTVIAARVLTKSWTFGLESHRSSWFQLACTCCCKAVRASSVDSADCGRQTISETGSSG